MCRERCTLGKVPNDRRRVVRPDVGVNTSRRVPDQPNSLPHRALDRSSAAAVRSTALD
ncbi:hypothetical protein SCOCK_150087 [Actinacidiphila cocklensis]|uniref:Uncharacterized protein n=1 Tax=Actinacidiphila cocklensis TaxID=887465 RepID=A0A9W4GP55_9ACTN|nr:hypothetical protein SCOCK_150087 [Actinacidiphila cocklensis]